ncbi:pescadillo-like protein [Artemisia annua]|uniref:Pescadillo-like protein n=1 Tax=Artemisia annua TaxID=35608 RepID=A0A2U1LHV8_ARTAN|nr:pescadillo-like protein [Artemisia annua]
MKRKLEEMESENHDDFPAVMKIVKGYCEEKKKKEEETRPPRRPRWSDRNLALHMWRGVCRSKGVKLHKYVLATDCCNMTREEIKLDMLWRKLKVMLPFVTHNMLICRNEPGAVTNLVVNAAFGSEDDEETTACKTLFQNKTFFQGREIGSEGDGAPFEESNQEINYQYSSLISNWSVNISWLWVVDRPTQSHKFISKDYRQPQWFFDFINARIILPTEDYMVGKVLPPHLHLLTMKQVDMHPEIDDLDNAHLLAQRIIDKAEGN